MWPWAPWSFPLVSDIQVTTAPSLELHLIKACADQMPAQPQRWVHPWHPRKVSTTSPTPELQVVQHTAGYLLSNTGSTSTLCSLLTPQESMSRSQLPSSEPSGQWCCSQGIHFFGPITLSAPVSQHLIKMQGAYKFRRQNMPTC